MNPNQSIVGFKTQMSAYFFRVKKKKIVHTTEKEQKSFWYLFFLSVQMLIKQGIHKYGNQNYFPKKAYI